MRVGVVGCGYWGSKHVRVFSTLPSVSQVVIIDGRSEIRRAVGADFPDALQRPGLTEALDEVDAVVIATPPESHFDIAAEVGGSTATSRAFDFRVTDDEIDLRLVSSVNRPLLAALEFERLPDDHFEYECVSDLNSTGAAATIDFVGSTGLADDRLTLIANDLPTNTFCVFFQGAQPLQMNISGGVLCVDAPLFRHAAVQAVGNVAEYDLVPSAPPVPAAQIAAGSTWRFQGWFRDGGTSPQWGFTSALKLVFTP